MAIGSRCTSARSDRPRNRMFMPDQFQSLIKAILDDNRERARELLAQNAALANATALEARLEMRLPHWIYAGDSALHVAAAGYRVEIAKLLLDAGADCRAAKNHRKSQPLHYAADGCPGSEFWDSKRQVRMLELLLDSGADIHARDKNGATPLHRAVRTRCAEAVKILLDSGADATFKTNPVRRHFISQFKTPAAAEAVQRRRSRRNVKLFGRSSIRESVRSSKT